MFASGILGYRFFIFFWTGYVIWTIGLQISFFGSTSIDDLALWTLGWQIFFLFVTTDSLFGHRCLDMVASWSSILCDTVKRWRLWANTTGLKNVPESWWQGQNYVVVTFCIFPSFHVLYLLASSLWWFFFFFGLRHPPIASPSRQPPIFVRRCCSPVHRRCRSRPPPLVHRRFVLYVFLFLFYFESTWILGNAPRHLSLSFVDLDCT